MADLSRILHSGARSLNVLSRSLHVLQSVIQTSCCPVANRKTVDYVPLGKPELLSSDALAVFGPPLIPIAQFPNCALSLKKILVNLSVVVNDKISCLTPHLRKCEYVQVFIGDLAVRKPLRNREKRWFLP